MAQQANESGGVYKPDPVQQMFNMMANMQKTVATAPAAPKPASTGQYTTPTAPAPKPAAAPAPTAPAPTAPGPMATNTASGVEMDPDYLAQIAMFDKMLNDARTQRDTQLSQLEQNRGLSEQEIGQARTDALEQLLNEYSARGGAQGTPYANARLGTEGRFDKEIADLVRQFTEQSAAVNQGFNDVFNQDQLLRNQAMQDAIMRRQQTILSGLSG